MIYGSSDIEHNKQNFLSFWTIFCSFTRKINILKKWKKTPGDIIILHTCTINYNHMMYGFWGMEHDRQNFFSFWTIFYPFTPLKLQNIKISKKWEKKHGDIIVLQKCIKNHDHIPYCFWDMAHDRCNFYFHFRLFFVLLPP